MKRFWMVLTLVVFAATAHAQVGRFNTQPQNSSLLKNVNISGTLAQNIVSTTAATSTTTVDWSVSNVWKLTVTTPTTIVFANPPSAGSEASLDLALNMPSPSVVVTLPAATWNYGVSPSFTTSTTGNSRQRLLFTTSDGGASYRAWWTGRFMQ